MSLDYSIPKVETPPPAQDLMPEAKSRARRRHWVQAASGLLVVAVAATASFLILDRPGKTPSFIGTVPAAAWAAAKATCEHQNLTSYGATPHLYGAYPTTVRLALNWPTKIYPTTTALTPTTLNNGAHSGTNSNDGWPSGTNTSRPAVICIFTGNFKIWTPAMGGPWVQHAKVLLVSLLTIPPLNFSNANITSTNSIPNRPVPVAVSTQ